MKNYGESYKCSNYVVESNFLKFILVYHTLLHFNAACA